MTTPDIEPVHVVYAAEASCPGRAKFVEEVMARTPKIAMAEANRAKRTFVVTVRATESGFVGRLEIQAGDPTATTREITGQSCPAVAPAAPPAAGRAECLRAMAERIPARWFRARPEPTVSWNRSLASRLPVLLKPHA